MSWFLFPIYLILFTWLITKISFFKVEKVDKRAVILLFILKVAAAIIYGLILSGDYYADKADTWQFYKESIKETQLLYDNPGEYFTNLFKSS